MRIWGEHRRRRRKIRLEIIPMIDVMFLLLVFYILSTAALVNQQAIPVQLPHAATGQQDQSASEVTVTVTREGDVFLDQEKVAEAELGAAMRRRAERYPGGLPGLQERGVVLNADLSVRHRQVVTVMDTLRGVGISRFAIATEGAGR